MVRPRAHLPFPGTTSADADPRGVVSSGVTASCWTATCPPQLTRPLAADESAQVCILGAGISGMTAAYRLVQEGVDVVVLDDGAVGSGETGRTTAHFTNAIDDRYELIEKKHGRSGARLAAESHTKAIDTVEETVRREAIDCRMERVDGYLFLHPSDSASSLEKEYRACQRVGVDVEWVDRAPHFDTGRAIRFPRQLQLHPLEYLRGLLRAVEAGGGRVYTESRGRPKAKGKVEANGHTVRAEHVLVCTNAPVTTRLRIHAKQMPFRSYVLAAEIPRGAVPHAMWWDTGDYDAPSPFPPYHYVRTQEFADGREMLIVGGQDHQVGAWENVKVDPHTALEEWTRARFPEAGEVLYRWSGQVLEPADNMAFIGQDPTARRRGLATGDSGNGMTHGTIAGILLADFALGRRNPWARLYEPRRIRLGAIANVVKEQAHAAKKVGLYVQKGEVGSAAELGPGEGAVLGRLRPKAVYRDDEGVLHVQSAVCRHLGCVVAWNPLERSFDCPCHGSRYTAYGCVVNGPAHEDLPPAKLTPRDLRPSGEPPSPKRRRTGMRTETERNPPASTASRRS